MDNKEDLEELVERINECNKRKKFEERRKNCPLTWALDESPYSTSRAFLFDDYKQTKFYYFVRKWVSWYQLSILSSMSVFKLGLSSIVIAPIIANVSRFAKDHLFFDYPFPIQMAFLFLSGLFYVVAIIVYSIRCPSYVSEMFQSKTVSPFLEERLRQLENDLILKIKNFMEFRKIRQEPKNNFQRSTLKINLIIEPPSEGVIFGFSNVCQVYIEDFCKRIAKELGVQVFSCENFKFELFFSKTKPHEKTSSTLIKTENLKQLKVKRLLDIEPHKEFYDIEALEKDGEKGDILLFWEPSDIQDVGKLKYMNIFAEDTGIRSLINEKTERIVREILSEWKNYERPKSRLATLLSFMLSILFLLSYLLHQVYIVIRVL